MTGARCHKQTTVLGRALARRSSRYSSAARTLVLWILAGAGLTGSFVGADTDLPNEGDGSELQSFWLHEPDLMQALRDMEDGLPVVAARRFQRAVEADEPAGGPPPWSPAERRWIGRMEFQALVQSGQSMQALQRWQEGKIDVDGWDEWPFWHGHAMAETGRFQQAVELLAEVPADSVRWAEANLARGSMLRTLGRMEEAEDLLVQVVAAAKNGVAREAAIMLAELRLAAEKAGAARSALNGIRVGGGLENLPLDYLLARVDLALGKNENAAERFGRIQALAPDAWLAEASLIGLSEAKARNGLHQEAAEMLIRSLEQRGDTRLTAAKTRLAVQHGALSDPEMLPRFERLAEGDDPAGWQAKWHLAVDLADRPGTSERVESLLQSLARSQAPGRLRTAAMERRLALYLESGRTADAEAVLAELQEAPRALADDRLEYYRAEIQLESGNLGEAWHGFRRLAGSSASGGQPNTSPLARLSAVNALAIAAMIVAEDDEAAELLGRIARDNEDIETPVEDAEGLLEAGLELGRQRHSDAQALLERFVALAPDHPRVVEAWIALAELHLLAFPPRVGSVEASLEQGRAVGPTPEQLERLDYLAVWAAASGDDRSQVFKLARDFLERHQNSKWRTEIRMKQAENYYRNEDFANAAAQFKLAAEEDAPTDLAMAALLFAGRASAALMSPDGLNEAIELWQIVADSGSDLAAAARIQQAVVLRRLGRWEEALGLIDYLLDDAESLDQTQRASVLCSRGQMLMAAGAAESLGMNRQEAMEQATASLEQVLQAPAAPLAWRHEAGYRLARIERERGNWAAALELCQDIMRPIDGADAAGPREYEWFVRAGYEAIDILESRQDWRGALRVAERIAAVPGNRSQEARDLANRIRLEHFLWEDR